jgi:hypothetical protein
MNRRDCLLVTHRRWRPVGAQEFAIVQDFPPDCMLMARGQARPGSDAALPNAKRTTS